MRKRFEKETHDGWYVFIAASMLAIFVVDIEKLLSLLRIWMPVTRGADRFQEIGGEQKIFRRVD